MLSLQNICRMPFGMKRRAAIIEYLISDPENFIAVNRKCCINLKYDSDLNYMLKKKILKRTRFSAWSTKTTRLVIK
jgi:hypothetical protein